MAVVTRSLAEQVEGLLRDRILDGLLPPGSRIDASELASEFGVSVMPVRDAIKRLERDGLVVVRPRRGVSVAAGDAKLYRDVMDTRIALETQAMVTAVERIPAGELDALLATYNDCAARLAQGANPDDVLAPSDGALHDLIVRHCGNPVLAELWATLFARARWGRRTLDVRQRYIRSFEEHRWVLEAMRARDRAAAIGRLREHLTRARDEILPLVEQQRQSEEEPLGGR